MNNFDYFCSAKLVKFYGMKAKNIAFLISFFLSVGFACAQNVESQYNYGGKEMRSEFNVISEQSMKYPKVQGLMHHVNKENLY